MSDSKLKPSLLVVLLISVVLNSAGQLLMKSVRGGQPGTSLVSSFLHFELWVAIILYGFSALAWLWVLSRAPLSLAYPVLALSFPIVVGLSALLFSETISTIHWLGVSVIVVGVSLLSRT
jgi:undecaprenyl phosphate-alpha-L-ara4N flippase subunit ArnE